MLAQVRIDAEHCGARHLCSRSSLSTSESGQLPGCSTIQATRTRNGSKLTATERRRAAAGRRARGSSRRGFAIKIDFDPH
jgi:hypothetical protein